MSTSIRSEDLCEPATLRAGTSAKLGRRKRPTVPLDQRKRAKKACELCRHNKLKCDGQHPCSRCLRTERHCDYADFQTAPERGDAFQDVDNAQQTQEAQQYNAEKLRLLENILAKLHPDMRTDDLNALRNYNSSDVDYTTTVEKAVTRHPHRNLTTSPRLGDVGQEALGRQEGIGRTPMPTATITVINQGKTHFEGRFSSWTFFKSARQIVTGGAQSRGNVDDEGESMGHGDSDLIAELNQDGNDEPIPQQSSTFQYAPDLKTMALAALPPRDVVDFLVATFFRSAQGNQFYIHPEIFSRKLSALYDGTHEFDVMRASDSKRSSEFICLMFMVFAIGSQFAEVESLHVEPNQNYPQGRTQPSVSASADIPTLEFSRLKVPKPSQSPGWHFYEISRRLLSDVVTSSSMTSVQVCVLQGIFLPSAKSRDAGYNLLGLALRMAVNMGMHRSFGTESLHPHVRELRNRLWWSVYVAERIFSVEMGRPLAINDTEIDAPLPADMPEWEDMTGKSPINVDGLISMIKLCHLLGKIVDAVYCKPASGEGTIMNPRMFRQLQDEVEKSRNDLPLRLRPSVGESSSRSVAHVSLAYEQATILLTRSCLNYAAVASHSWTLPDATSEFVRQQARTCMRSAVTTIRIMFSLRSKSQLCRFSFHDSLYCTAALYVLLLGKDLEWLSSEVVRESIRQGVLILLDLAEGSELAASALKYILQALQKDISTPEEAGEGTVPDEDTKLEKGRKAWKAWVALSSSGSVAKSACISDSNADSTSMVDSEDVGGSPALFSGRNNIHRSSMMDLPSCWILQDLDFDVFGRDLTAVPEIPLMGNHNFL